MALIKWSDDLSVNVDLFDKHHKKFIDLMNELHDAMSCGKAEEVVGKTVKEMVDYAKYHFGEEERMMRERHYRGYSQHKVEHDKFVKQIQEFSDRLEAGKASISMGVLSYLRDWWVSHILSTDRLYSIVFADERVA